MIAFRVEVNGKRACVASIGQQGVLSAIVNYIGRARSREMFLSVGGLCSPTEEHATWGELLPLKMGDRVVVTVIQTNSPDKPRQRYRRNSKTGERNEKAYVRAMAKKFGWKVLSRTKQTK